MAVKIADAKIGGKQYSKDKLIPGRYLCVVDDLREKETRGHGDGFFLDFTVERALTEGGSPAQTKGSYAVFPDDARGSTKILKTEAKALEEGKIVLAVAACMGKTRDEVEFVTQARFDAALKRPVSPLKGKKIVIVCVPYTSKSTGKASSYYEVYPESAKDDVVEEEAAEAPVEKAPAKKAAPKASKQAVFPPAPWEVAGKDADGDVYYWNTETDETCYEADLREQLAA